MCSSAEKAPRDKRLRRDTGSSDKRTGKLWDTVRTSGQRCQSWQDGCGSWWTSVDLYIKGHRGLRWGKLRRIHCGFFCERNTVSVPRRLNGYKKQGMEKLLWLETAVRECVCVCVNRWSSHTHSQGCRTCVLKAHWSVIEEEKRSTNTHCSWLQQCD